MHCEEEAVIKNPPVVNIVVLLQWALRPGKEICENNHGGVIKVLDMS